MSLYIKSTDGTQTLLASGSVHGRMSVNPQCCLLRYLPAVVSGAYRVGQVLEERLVIRDDVILGNQRGEKTGG
jgi:hypothetical protein